MFPPDATTDVAGVLPLANGGVEQVLLLGGEDGVGNCGTSRVVVCHEVQSDERSSY